MKTRERLTSGTLFALTAGLVLGCGGEENSDVSQPTGSSTISSSGGASGTGTAPGSVAGNPSANGTTTNASGSGTAPGASSNPAGSTNDSSTDPTSGTSGTTDGTSQTDPPGDGDTTVMDDAADPAAGADDGAASDDGSEPVVVESGDLTIDDFEDGDVVISELDGLAGRWSTYNDETGTQVPAAGTSVTPTEGGANGSAYAISTTGSGFTEWGAGLQVDLNNAGGRNPYDATAFEGISFQAKGSGSVRVELVTMAITEPSGGGTCAENCYDAHGFTIELSADWQEHVIAFGDLTQEGWGTEAAFAPTELLGINFKVAPAEQFELWLDDVQFLETAGSGGGGATDDVGTDDDSAEPDPPMTVEPTSTPGMCSMDIGRYDGNGSVTFYYFDQGSAEINCGYQITNRNPDTVANIYTGNGQYFGAMNTSDYNTAAVCGACVEVTRDGNRSVVITVVDRCPIETNPKCTAGHIDLSRAAFQQIGQDQEGHLGTGNGGAVGSISWRYVECPVGDENVKYRLKEPDNNGWNELLVQSHRFPISSVEIDGQPATRKEYNYWEPPSNMGSGPWTIKVTDVVGSTIESTVERGPADIDSGTQFSCQ